MQIDPKQQAADGEIVFDLAGFICCRSVEALPDIQVRR